MTQHDIGAHLGVQLAQVDGSVAALEARISQKQGIPIDRVSSTGAPFPPYRNKPDPDMVVGMSTGFLILIGLPISIAYARRIWRGKPAGPPPRVALRSSPAGRRGVAGSRMRIPGQWAKMLSPDWLWYGPPPRR